MLYTNLMMDDWNELLIFKKPTTQNWSSYCIRKFHKTYPATKTTLQETSVIFVTVNGAVYLLWSTGQSVPLGYWKHFHQSKENLVGWMIVSQQHNKIPNSAWGHFRRAKNNKELAKHQRTTHTSYSLQSSDLVRSLTHTHNCYPTSGVGSHVRHLLKGIQEGHSSQNSGSRWTENIQDFR